MPKDKHDSGSLDYIGVLFRHLDRQSAVLMVGLGIAGNQNLLTSYYSMCMHLEALLTPYLDDKYYTKVKDLHGEMPGFKKTMQFMDENVVFLRWCSRWMRLLVAYMQKNKLLKFQAKNWEQFDNAEKVLTTDTEN